jgi:hypothetical protein
MVLCVIQGKSLFVTYKAIGELKPDGMREVFFELNGIPRTVEVFDELVTPPNAARTPTVLSVVRLLYLRWAVAAVSAALRLHPAQGALSTGPYTPLVLSCALDRLYV